MTHYILEALSNRNSSGNRFNSSKLKRGFQVTQQTNDLALKIALKTLEMKVFVSEENYPVLCECIRRKRGELAVVLLFRNCHSVELLGVILDKLLDPTLHHIYK